MVIGAASAGLSLSAHCSPTGVARLDAGWTALFAGLVAWAAATSPWWALGLGSATLVAAGPTPGWTVLAAIATVVAMAIGARGRGFAVVRALLGAFIGQEAIRLQLHPFGRSSLVAGGVSVLLVVTGVSRRSGLVRRRCWIGAAGFAAAVVLAGAGLAGALGLAARPLITSERSIQSGLRAMRNGDPGQAASDLKAAARALGRANSWLRSPLAGPARLFPVMSQHARLLRHVTAIAHTGATTVAQSVLAMNPAAIRVSKGSVDVDSIGLLERPLRDTRDAVAALERSLVSTQSPWIVAPLRDRFSFLGRQATYARRQGDIAIRVVRLAASMLGHDGPRTYFVAFISPAEARGLGGFLGNFAEVVAVDGAVSVTRFGRTIDLIAGGDPHTARRVTRPADYLARYGRFGATTKAGAADPEFWDNVTMSPDLPSVAEVIAQLYPTSGGTKIDGVITIDPEGLRALLAITGPVKAQRSGLTLDRTNVVSFLLRDQYLQFPNDDPARKDALADVAATAMSALLTGAAPNPAQLAGTLGPALRDGHIQIWSLDARDQVDLRALGVSGELPRPRGDGFAVTISNGAPNKIDAYLTKATRYEAVVDPVSGAVEAKLTVTLTNAIPGTALPPVVVGNVVGAPSGTSISYVTVFSPLQLVAARVDGVDVPWVPEVERGWKTYSRFVRIAPHAAVMIEMTLRGRIDVSRGYWLQLRPQPGAMAEGVSVDVRTRNGLTVLRRRQRLETSIQLRGGLSWNRRPKRISP